MCDPISMALGSLVVGTAKSVAQFKAESAAADQQNAYYRENAARANKAAQEQMFQTQQRMLQEQEAGAEEKIKNMRDARADRASATVAAGESGASGLSVDALLREFSINESQANDAVDRNTELSINQLQNEITGIRANAEDRINGVQRAAKPSFFNTGLKIAGQGLDAYSMYSDLKEKRKPKA